MDSKHYNKIKLLTGISEGIITFVLLLFFVISGLSCRLQSVISIILANSYLQFISFTFAVGIILGIILFPFNFYSSFHLEHKFKLSNQTFFMWLQEGLKSVLVSALIGLPLLIFFYFVLNKFGELWWLPLSAGMFFFTVILAQLMPILILPIFYKISALQNETLKSNLNNLAKQAGIKIENIYSFNLSKNTKKANAAFTGLGRTKRILLADTLLSNYTDEEIETVVAHELGHYKKKHIIKNLILSTFFSFFSLYIIALLYKNSISWFGFNSLTEIAALPILSLWAMLISLIISPIANYISRKFEFQADQYAVLSTKKPNAFQTVLEKLNDQNLGDKDPHPLVEWLFYSHPSIKKRIDAINKISDKEKLTAGKILPNDFNN